MIRRAYLHTIIPLATACAALAMPAAGLAVRSTATDSPPAGSGGTGLAGQPSAGSGAGTTSGSATTARRADATVSASGHGITVRTVESGLLRHTLDFTGTVPSSDAGRTIVIEHEGSASTSDWVTATQATVTGSGAFSAVWRVNQAGHVAIRAVLVRSGATALRANRASGGSAKAAGTAPAPTGPASRALTITVFRPAVASFYGPGFWGHRTACGQRLTRTTLGVASRTLPCGTHVTVLYGGRAITVNVIDRGPYARGIGWDLTEATAQALGMTGNATVGTIATR